MLSCVGSTVASQSLGLGIRWARGRKSREGQRAITKCRGENIDGLAQPLMEWPPRAVEVKDSPARRGRGELQPPALEAMAVEGERARCPSAAALGRHCRDSLSSSHVGLRKQLLQFFALLSHCIQWSALVSLSFYWYRSYGLSGGPWRMYSVLPRRRFAEEGHSEWVAPCTRRPGLPKWRAVPRRRYGIRYEDPDRPHMLCPGLGKLSHRCVDELHCDADHTLRRCALAVWGHHEPYHYRG